MKLYNTASRSIETFTSLIPQHVGMYTCGQTVYDFTHIGHGRKYTNDDILRRVFTYLGYEVTHVQNVTDVGHLVSDADEGEDKLEKGARKYGKTVWEVAEFYTKHFYDSMDTLNILRPHVICKATEHIKEQIDLIQILLQKGHAYETSTGIFFSIDTFPKYAHLFGQNLLDQKVGVREEVVVDTEKKNPADFALWFKLVGHFKNHMMHWASPWGEGFPGWHIECSAMSMEYLGATLDVHTGGIDHIAVHHPNEIAQSESATAKRFVNYWVHHAFLTVEGQKMSKSVGNTYRVEDIQEKGYDALSLRYLYLSAHYRRELNFTWESLDASQIALRKLKEHMKNFKEEKGRQTISEEKVKKVDDFRDEFLEAIENDLNMPEALAVIWKIVKSSIPSEDKYDLIREFDQVLGLELTQYDRIEIPVEINALGETRKEAKASGDFKKADKLRAQIQEKGYTIKDNSDNTFVIQKI